MKGEKAYLACPDYDRLEVYHWKHDHYGQLALLEEEVYRHIPELDRERYILSYISGIDVVDGEEGFYYDAEYLVGEDTSVGKMNDQLITDGEF